MLKQSRSTSNGVSKKIHRFITDYKKTKDTLEINDPELLHQIRSVLKLRNGEKCIITNGDNIEYVSEIIELEKSFIKLNIQEKNIVDTEPSKKVTLYLAILKKENFELVLQKAGEMGIYKIVPVITERTVKTNLNFERLNKISREASELSGRNSVTIIEDIQNYKEAVLGDTNQNKVLFNITGEPVESEKLKVESLSIYIGPEGGFTDTEINFAKDLPAQTGNNFEIYNLGKLTLRGETAGIIASYLALQ